MIDLILFGPPGAGKGTQAKMLSSGLALRHISTGDVLRRAIRDRRPLGLEAEGFMNRGQLVPDGLVTRIVAEEISESPNGQGALWDGYPRTVEQGRELDGLLLQRSRQIDAVIFLDVPESVLVARLSGRRSCPGCGAMYHVDSKAPATSGVCDICKHELITRHDDDEDVVRERLSVYQRQTRPLLEIYGTRQILHTVDGAGTADDVQRLILSQLKGIS